MFPKDGWSLVPPQVHALDMATCLHPDTSCLPEAWLSLHLGFSLETQAIVSTSVALDPDPWELMNMEILGPHPRPITICSLLRGPLPGKPLRTIPALETGNLHQPACALHYSLLFCVSPPRGVPENRALLCLPLGTRGSKQGELWSPRRQAALSGDIFSCSNVGEKGHSWHRGSRSQGCC